MHLRDLRSHWILCSESSNFVILISLKIPSDSSHLHSRDGKERFLASGKLYQDSPMKIIWKRGFISLLLLSFQGCDCLGYIKYFDAHFTNFTGGLETIENCVGLHEEDHGILWKHQDWRTSLAEVRRSRLLTVSLTMNMDFTGTFIWMGKIEADVKLTGILSLGALLPGEVQKYGTTIAPGLYATVHEHFFVARMDIAVDCKLGEAHNQVVEVNARVEAPGENNVHNNAVYAEERLLKTELEAMRECNRLTARHCIIVRMSVVQLTSLTGMGSLMLLELINSRRKLNWQNVVYQKL